MSRYNDVLLNADLPLAELAARIGDLIGSKTAPLPNPPEGAGDWYHLELGDDMFARVGEPGYLDDEPHVPWTTFRFVVVVTDYMRKGYDAQDAAAWRLYRAIVANTTWPTMLVLDDGADVVASRGVFAQSA